MKRKAGNLFSDLIFSTTHDKRVRIPALLMSDQWKNFNRSCLYVCMLFVLLFVLGCGDSNRASLTGMITVNGEPVENGSISFTPLEGTESSAAGATIKDGRYVIESKRGPLKGEFKVLITGTHKTGKKIKEPGTGKEIDEQGSVIPVKYDPLRGGKEVIKYTVTPGKNEFSIDLTR